ncbi:MAG: hypothetical protein NVS3B18_07700 [Candidatus Dormibacteria bacterium]
MLVGIGLAVGAILAVIVALGTPGERSTAPGGPAAGRLGVERLLAGIPQHGLTLGDPRAPATLIEFADLQCPFCRAYSRDLLPGLVRDYVRPGRLKMVFRAVPALGPDSLRAARAAGSAAQANRLWQFTALFYLNQGIENSGYVTDAFLRQIARGAGAPVGQADPGIDETRRLVHSYGLKVTPSFLLGRTGGASLRAVAGADQIRASLNRLGG